MQYSLFNRFCGVLLGAAAGEHQGSRAEKPLRSPSAVPAGSELPQPRWSQFMVATVQSLVACQTLDLADCQQRFSATPELRSPLKQMDVSEVAIVTLPLVLFFHEDDLKLRQALQSASQLLASPPDSMLGAWVIGVAIAQALQEKLYPPTLIEQILASLPSVAAETAITNSLVQQLQQVQSLVSQRAGLESARSHLIRQAANSVDPKTNQQTMPIALALYCWLSTPQDSQLAVVRSQRLVYRSTVVGALTGALTGAYNGCTSLPVNWCFAVEPPNQSATSDTSQLPQMSWVALAADLLATWSGTFELRDSTSSQARQLPAIAAPRVIRPR